MLGLIRGTVAATAILHLTVAAVGSMLGLTIRVAIPAVSMLAVLIMTIITIIGTIIIAVPALPISVAVSVAAIAILMVVRLAMSRRYRSLFHLLEVLRRW